MKLIENPRAVWRHYSTQALAFVMSLGTLWAGLPDWVRTTLPSWVATTVAWTVAGVAALGLAGKFADQSKNDPTQTEGQGEQK